MAQAVVTGTTTYTDTYVYRPGGTPLELVRQTSGGATNRYWYEVDGRGNVVALTDSTGTVVDSYAYDLWGVPTTITQTVPQQLRYAGYWYDNELGWYWLSSRIYDPVLERFLQPDPSETSGQFNYVYANDDPIDAKDPTGFATQGGSDSSQWQGQIDPNKKYYRTVNGPITKPSNWSINSKTFGEQAQGDAAGASIWDNPQSAAEAAADGITSGSRTSKTPVRVVEIDGKDILDAGYNGVYTDSTRPGHLVLVPTDTNPNPPIDAAQESEQLLRLGERAGTETGIQIDPRTGAISGLPATTDSSGSGDSSTSNSSSLPSGGVTCS